MNKNMGINERERRAQARKEQEANKDAVRARRRNPEGNARAKAADLLKHISGLGVGKMSNPEGRGEKILAGLILEGQPISFVGFWGVGPKAYPDAADKKYVSQLREKVDYVAKEHVPGAAFTLILADLHGVFNGFIPPDGRSAYLDGVEKMLQDENIATVRLSELYSRYGLELPQSRNPINPIGEANHAYRRYKDKYDRSARRHHRGEEAANGGYWYVAMRLQEREMLEGEFPDSYLLVNGNKMTAAPLMPKRLPVIYLPEGPVWFSKGKN